MVCEKKTPLVVCTQQQQQQQSSSSSSNSGTGTVVSNSSMDKSSIKLKLIESYFEESPSLQILYNMRPTRFNEQWSSYDSLSSMWTLCEHLDTNVETEKNLKGAIKARYELVEPELVFLTEGSEYIGRQVNRVFGKRAVIGTIVGYLPEDGDDPALWHVRHLDGDAEDLELHEVLSSLVSNKDDDKETTTGSSSGSSSSSDNANTTENMDIVPSSTIATASTGTGSFKSVTQDKDTTSAAAVAVTVIADTDNDELNTTDEYEPVVISHFPIYKRHYPRVSDNSIGLFGLQQELLNTQRYLLDGLKKQGSDYSKTTKKVWEESVRDAYSLDGFKLALKVILLEELLDIYYILYLLQYSNILLINLYLTIYFISMHITVFIFLYIYAYIYLYNYIYIYTLYLYIYLCLPLCTFISITRNWKK